MKDMKLTKMYMLISPSTHLIYVGHTTQRLSKRHYTHKRLNNCSSKQITAFGDSKIILIENYECETAEEARKREQEIIDEYGDKCVNCNRAYNSIEDNKAMIKKQTAEYYTKNTDKIKKQMAEYYAKNVDKIKKRDAEYYTKNADKIKEKWRELYEKNKDAITQRKRELYEKNKDAIKQRRKELYEKKKQQKQQQTDQIDIE